MRQFTGGDLAERYILSPLCLFVMTLSILIKLSQAETEIRFLQRNNTFNLKITLDRRSPRLKLDDGLLPGPSHFSLLSAFKLVLIQHFIKRAVVRRTYLRIFRSCTFLR